MHNLSVETQCAEKAAEVPKLDHPGDFKIKVPGTLEMLPSGVQPESACAAFFDGGSAKRLGTAGYVCFKPDGTLWFGAGLVLPPHQRTNNAAELAACTALVEELHSRGELPGGAQCVVLHGDS